MGRNVWDWIVICCKGEHLALLGPRNSGKTTLHSYIRQNGRGGAPESTLAPERTEWIRNPEMGLDVWAGRDLPGAEANYEDWKTQFERSSKVFYLFDAHQVRTDDGYADRVRREGRMIRDWRSDDRRVMMIGTHADTDPLAKELSPARYLDLIADLEVVAAFRTRSKVKGFAVGSLTTSEESAALVTRALS